MKNVFKYGFLAIALTLSFAACNTNKADGDKNDTTLSDTTMMDTTMTDTADTSTL